MCPAGMVKGAVLRSQPLTHQVRRCDIVTSMNLIMRGLGTWELGYPYFWDILEQKTEDAAVSWYA